MEPAVTGGNTSPLLSATIVSSGGSAASDRRWQHSRKTPAAPRTRYLPLPTPAGSASAQGHGW